MQTEITVHVVAPPRAVFDLARDVTSWPDLLPHYRQVTVYSRNGDRLIAVMKATRQFGPLSVPVWWRSEQWSDGTDPSDLQLRFVHVGGATRGMDVTWHIRPEPTGSVVSIEHTFARPIPVLGDQIFARLIDRLFVRPIAGRTLATFKALAEMNELAGAA